VLGVQARHRVGSATDRESDDDPEIAASQSGRQFGSRRLEYGHRTGGDYGNAKVRETHEGLGSRKDAFGSGNRLPVSSQRPRPADQSEAYSGC
jgi:hypothetical protein